MQTICPLTPEQRGLLDQHDRAVLIAQHQLHVAESARANLYSAILAAHVLAVKTEADAPDVRVTDAGLVFDVPSGSPHD